MLLGFSNCLFVNLEILSGSTGVFFIDILTINEDVTLKNQPAFVVGH